MKTEMVVEGRKIEIGLDRTVIGLPYPKLSKKDGENPTAEELNLLDAQRKSFVSHLKYIESVIHSGEYHCSSVKGTNLKRYKVFSDIDGKLLCILTLGLSFSTAVINFEFNPSKLNSDSFAEIDGLLSVMFYDHYDELFENGVVSHAEFFIDIYGEELSNLALIDSERRSTTKYKGTTYQGRRGSRFVGIMYDKAKQLKNGGQLVRIEVRINRRDIRLKDLVEQDLFNPLSTLLAVEVIQMQVMSNKLECPHLGNNMAELGLYGAVKNAHARKAIWQYLAQHAAPWWRPDTFWAGHRQLLMKLKPGHAGVFS